MIIEQLGWDKDRGQIVFILNDELGWEDEDLHIRALQEKLNACMASIEHGTVFQRLSAELGHEVPRHSPIKVILRGTHPLTAQGQAFFNYARNAFAEAQVGLFFRLAGSDDAGR